MGAALAIANRDIKGFLVSPKAGIVFFTLLMIMGVFFKDYVITVSRYQQQAMMSGGQAPTIDQLMRALFSILNLVLVIVVPIVTMATFAEERRSHSLRILQTAPISARQIVIGKFLMAAGLMGLVLAASFVYPAFTYAFGKPDLGTIASSYLGMFLLICAQLSFGLWISAMTSSQFMACLLTMLGLFLLLILNIVAPSLTGGGALESAVQYLASTPHVDQFLKGMITVADVTYFLCFTALFLFFTNVALDSQRWR